MSSGYLLDANVLSEPLRPQPRVGVVERLARHEDELATSATVWHELLYGAARLPPSKRKRHIDEYLAALAASSLVFLAYEERAAGWHARERARLAAIGRTPSSPDGQIAAVARVHGLVLVTRNVSDFEAFEGLRIENWFEDVAPA